MPFIGLSLLIAIIAIVHVIKTGRSQLWIMVLLALPGLGAIAYFIVEVLPELSGSRGGRQAASKLGRVLAPNKSLDEAKREYEIAPTVENACALADIHLEKDQYQQARDLYHESLSGLYENNPDIMYKLAASEFGLDNFAESQALLDSLIEINPDYKNQDAHLLYARSLAELGELEQATEEYETLISYYSGPEPAYRYGMLLKSQGNDDEARKVFTALLDKSSKSPAHYRKLHHEWISLASREL